MLPALCSFISSTHIRLLRITHRRLLVVPPVPPVASPPPPDKHSLTLVAVFQLATALAFSIVVMLGLERAGLGGHMKNEDIVGPLLLPPLHSLLLLQLLLLLRLVFWTVHLA